MKLILCLDDNKGMLFNCRRQSRDSEVIKDILNSLNGNELVITPFSQKLFADFEGSIIVSDTPLKENENAFFFNENLDVWGNIEIFDEFIVYFWNRVYPTDFKCNIDFEDLELISETEFKGSSHEKITKKIFRRA